MKRFEKLQDIWDLQIQSNTKPAADDIIKKSVSNTNKIIQNHFWTKVILSITSLILVCFYVWVGAYKQMLFSFGLSLMITMLLFRLVLEWISQKKLQNIKTDVALIEYSKQAHYYYQWRKKIHYIFTPIIYTTYIVGFTLLLPVFKENMSSGFYLYIVCSGFSFLIIFGLLMIRIIKKEIQLLHFLKSIS